MEQAWLLGIVGLEQVAERLRELSGRAGETPFLLSELTEDAFGRLLPIDRSRWIRSQDRILAAFSHYPGGAFELVTSICEENSVPVLPAWCRGRYWFAGPTIDSRQPIAPQAAWRRIHRQAMEPAEPGDAPSPGAARIFANLLLWLLTPACRQAAGPPARSLYRMDMATLEGRWHGWDPHPLGGGRHAIRWLSEEEGDAAASGADCTETIVSDALARLSSPVTGILHRWEEADLPQLPLSMCLAEPVDPLSSFPAETLPLEIGHALTHEQARREAGLRGIEAYMARLLQREGEAASGRKSFIGAGSSPEEALRRALLRYADEDLAAVGREPSGWIVQPMRAQKIRDAQSRDYLRLLGVRPGMPQIGIGETPSGFPAACVRRGERLASAAGRSIDEALQRALGQMLAAIQLDTGTEAEGANRRMEWREPGSSTGELACRAESGEAGDTEAMLAMLRRNGRAPRLFEAISDPFPIPDAAVVLYGINVNWGERA